MRDLDALLDAAAIDTVCCGGDRPVGLLTKRDADTLGAVTPSTKLKAEAILDAVEAHFGVRPETVWGAGDLPEHNNRRCLDPMVTTKSGGWLGGSKAKAWEIGDWVVELVWANRVAWGLRHIIWRRRIRSTTTSPGVWRSIPDRGSTTADHEDHPHIAFLSDAFTPLGIPTTVQEDDMTPDESAMLRGIFNTLMTGRPDKGLGSPEWPHPFTIAAATLVAAQTGARGVDAAAIAAAIPAELAREVADELAKRLSG